MDLGSRIRAMRSQKRLSLKELANQTGLTTSFLSQVERNLVSPSIKSLKEIATALNIKVGSLFEEEQKELVFIKKYRRKRFIDIESKSSYEILASGLLNISMKPLLYTLKVRGKIERKSQLHEKEEFGMIVKGKVELLRNKEKFIMEEGDSVYFVSTKPYRLRNIGKGNAAILWVVYTQY